MNNEQADNTVPETSTINEQKQSNSYEPPTSENVNTTQPNNAQPNNNKKTLSQEQKANQENLKRIMNSEKTTSLRNIEWRTVKTEMNRMNQVLPYISTNNITELNELIYTGAKLVGGKIEISSKSTKKNQKYNGKFDWKCR